MRESTLALETADGVMTTGTFDPASGTRAPLVVFYIDAAFSFAVPDHAVYGATGTTSTGC